MAPAGDPTRASIVSNVSRNSARAHCPEQKDRPWKKGSTTSDRPIRTRTGSPGAIRLPHRQRRATGATRSTRDGPLPGVREVVAGSVKGSRPCEIVTRGTPYEPCHSDFGSDLPVRRLTTARDPGRTVHFPPGHSVASSRPGSIRNGPQLPPPGLQAILASISLGSPAGPALAKNRVPASRSLPPEPAQTARGGQYIVIRIYAHLEIVRPTNNTQSHSSPRAGKL